MSNCICTESSPFSSIKKTAYPTLLKEYQEAKKPEYKGKDHWLSWFKTDGGRIVDYKGRFYLYLGTTTWRELRWYGKELKKLGAIFHRVKAKDESDGFRDWFWLKLDPDKML